MVAVALSALLLAGFSALRGSVLGVPGPCLVHSLTLVLGFLVCAAGGLAGRTGSRRFLWEEAPAVSEPPAPKDS